ncbi:hypothetical protein A5886_002194 [Enterococcus sp. 8G7_MSG3316]|uniref:Uncharacterized protein n=1 Tax=Candidatus Enterococcus testudinis TaxID=1834191 RepID=A0A242A7W3_9ENTE|nr:hypothetical protein [Enterococcus sp. 8G7_MSG3316]OTN77114.1 hypothetical protein A5886_002194 [Enterococcus sp. 8G7_MSG3316]
MTYTIQQELTIHDLAKDKIRSLHDELNDKKVCLTDHQRDQLLRELQRYQELLYANRIIRVKEMGLSK